MVIGIWYPWTVKKVTHEQTALKSLSDSTLRRCMESCMYDTTVNCKSVKFNGPTSVCELMSLTLEQAEQTNETSGEPWSYFISTWLSNSKSPLTV